MSYIIEMSTYAQRALKKIPKDIDLRIQNTLKKIALSPRIGEKLSGIDAYRVRVGDYRIIYEIYDNKLIVLVINIGHRKEIYR